MTAEQCDTSSIPKTESFRVQQQQQHLLSTNEAHPKISEASQLHTAGELSKNVSGFMIFRAPAILLKYLSNAKQ